MKRMWHHIGGVLFDAVCFAFGYGAALLAAFAGYDASLEQFWALRVTLLTVPLVLVALTSKLLRQDPTWRCWLRFALFDAMTFWMADDVPDTGLLLFVDATVFWFVLSGSQWRWRTVE